MPVNNGYILSIVIPTKNRQDYAAKTVKQILLIPDQDIQVIVQDNSDSDILEKMLLPLFGDKRLKYKFSSGVLSFVDNFSLAVSHADGEYICIIGDDDGINHEIVEVSRWAKSKNIDAIKPVVNNVYFWPDTGISNDFKSNSGYMMINKISSKFKFVNTDAELIKLMNNGCQKYLDLDLVKLYHGIVRKSKIELVKKITGRYFGGLSPDIYSSISLSLIIPRVLCIDYPLTISGVCKQSGSADSVTGKHTGEYESAPHLKGHHSYNWSTEVPKFYSVETIWADSALAAIKDMNRYDLLGEYKEEALIAYCIYKHNNYSSFVKKHYFDRMKDLNISSINAKSNLYLSVIVGPIYDFIKKVISKITRKKDDLIKLYNITDIIAAQDELSRYLDSNLFSIEKIINEFENTIDIGNDQL